MSPAVKYTLGRLGMFVVLLLLLIIVPIPLNVFVKAMIALVVSAALSYFLLADWRNQMGEQLAGAASRRAAEKNRLRAALAGDEEAAAAGDRLSDAPAAADDRLSDTSAAADDRLSDTSAAAGDRLTDIPAAAGDQISDTPAARDRLSGTRAAAGDRLSDDTPADARSAKAGAVHAEAGEPDLSEQKVDEKK